jgi:ElaB/YqjD/DUF883 family membrane-anchored ribosome-binding protein
MGILVKFKNRLKSQKFQSGGEVPLYASYKIKPDQTSADISPFSVLQKYQASKPRATKSSSKSTSQKTPKWQNDGNVVGLRNEVKHFTKNASAMESNISNGIMQAGSYDNFLSYGGSNLISQYDIYTTTALNSMSQILDKYKKASEHIDPSKNIANQDQLLMSTNGEEIFAEYADEDGKRQYGWIKSTDIDDMIEIGKDKDKKEVAKYKPIAIGEAMRLRKTSDNEIFIGEDKILDSVIDTINLNKLTSNLDNIYKTAGKTTDNSSVSLENINGQTIEKVVTGNYSMSNAKQLESTLYQVKNNIGSAGLKSLKERAIKTLLKTEGEVDRKSIDDWVDDYLLRDMHRRITNTDKLKNGNDLQGDLDGNKVKKIGKLMLDYQEAAKTKEDPQTFTIVSDPLDIAGETGDYSGKNKQLEYKTNTYNWGEGNQLIEELNKDKNKYPLGGFNMTQIKSNDVGNKMVDPNTASFPGNGKEFDTDFPLPNFGLDWPGDGFWGLSNVEGEGKTLGQLFVMSKKPNALTAMLVKDASNLQEGKKAKLLSEASEEAQKEINALVDKYKDSPLKSKSSLVMNKTKEIMKKAQDKIKKELGSDVELTEKVILNFVYDKNLIKQYMDKYNTNIQESFSDTELKDFKRLKRLKFQKESGEEVEFSKDDGKKLESYQQKFNNALNTTFDEYDKGVEFYEKLTYILSGTSPTLGETAEAYTRTQKEVNNNEVVTSGGYYDLVLEGTSATTEADETAPVDLASIQLSFNPQIKTKMADEVLVPQYTKMHRYLNKEGYETTTLDLFRSLNMSILSNVLNTEQMNQLMTSQVTN